MLSRSLRLGIVFGPTLTPGSSQPLVYTIRNSIYAVGYSWNVKRSRHGKESSILSKSYLIALSGDNGVDGAFLKRLHFYNIERMDNTILYAHGYSHLSKPYPTRFIPIILPISAWPYMAIQTLLKAINPYHPVITRSPHHTHPFSSSHISYSPPSFTPTKPNSQTNHPPNFPTSTSWQPWSAGSTQFKSLPPPKKKKRKKKTTQNGKCHPSYEPQNAKPHSQTLPS